MLAISQGKTAVAFERLFEAVVISVAIAVGVAVGLALGRNGVKLGRRIVGWRP
jgi:hypothetical protein